MWAEWERDHALDRVPVIGLSVPAFDGYRLLRTRSDALGHSVTLAYGEETDENGPFVSVTTQVSRRLPLTYVVAPARDALALERDRIFERTGIDEGDPLESRTEHAKLPLDAQVLTARARYEGTLWAAHARVPTEFRPAETAPNDQVVAIVVSRGVPLADVRLTVVRDLGPFWEAREAWLEAHKPQL
jgi:hypothetical protein